MLTKKNGKNRKIKKTPESVFFAKLHFFRQELVEHYAQDGTDCNVGNGKGFCNLDAAGQAQAADQHNGYDHQIAAMREVQLGFYQRAHTDGGNHAKQDDGYAAHNRAWDGGKEGLEYGENGGDAQGGGVVVFGNGQYTGVFTVSGVGRAAQEPGYHRGQTVAHQGTVQAGVFHKVLANYSAVSGDVADVFHEGNQSGRRDDEDSGKIEFR